MNAGTVTRVNGPVVEVAGIEASMRDFVEVGPLRLPGEVIALGSNSATVQVYEYTGGLQPGDPVSPTGLQLAAQLGPGLLGGVFDGMLRRLAGAADMLPSGARPDPLPLDQRWSFSPAASEGAAVDGGALLGVLP